MHEAPGQHPLVETWAISDRLNRFLLDAIPPDALAARPAEKGGRPVGEQFAHIHNVRMMWVRSAAAEHAAGLVKIERGEQPLDHPTLGAFLAASGDAVTKMVADAIQSGKRIKGFKPHTEAFVGYLIAHEAHHRGQIALTLRLAGHPLSKSAAFGLWEWGMR